MRFVREFVLAVALLVSFGAHAQAGTTVSVPGAGGTLIGTVTYDSPNGGTAHFHTFIAYEGPQIAIDVDFSLWFFPNQGGSAALYDNQTGEWWEFGYNACCGWYTNVGQTDPGAQSFEVQRDWDDPINIIDRMGSSLMGPQYQTLVGSGW